MHRPFPDKLLLLLIHGIKWPPKLLTPTGLHLRKDKGVVIPADKVDLSSSGRTEVLSENLPAETL